MGASGPPIGAPSAGSTADFTTMGGPSPSLIVAVTSAGGQRECRALQRSRDGSNRRPDARRQRAVLVERDQMRAELVVIRPDASCCMPSNSSHTCRNSEPAHRRPQSRERGR